ncbi:MAG: toxin-antitoxin system HicB family antitoxin [Patescibacteria group bacterium]
MANSTFGYLKNLHRQLAYQAKNEGVSLNSLISNNLSNYMSGRCCL